MIGSDAWVNAPTTGIPPEKVKEREDLAEAMADYERKHGPVVPQEIIVRGVSSKGINGSLPQKQREVMSKLRSGLTQIAEIAQALGWNNRSVGSCIQGLVKKGLVERTSLGRYAPVASTWSPKAPSRTI